MSQKYQQLKGLLKELFQLDQPDLDFGIYRILHAKSGEVTKFLEEDLLPQVKREFAKYRSEDKVEIEKELTKVRASVAAARMDPDQSPVVQELREKLAAAVDVAGLEGEVYDHLYRFFRRYYSEGDFLSKRVYKGNTYAIPYEGEEVKLHWANSDQYYIKTSEYLRDYAFRLRPENEQKPMRVHFRLVDAAEGEHGNAKAAEEQSRVFVLAEGEFITEEADELVIRFEYRPATVADWPVGEAKAKPPAQKDLIAMTVQRVLGVMDPALATWVLELGNEHYLASGEKAGYSKLASHLHRYTARHTFDYFIHKDLGGFLRRELDFYIKNEVMHLDDVESETAPRVEQFLSKIKVIRRIAGKIIDFVAQLEDFQKKLWLKKKFVVETRYCATLDRLPDTLYPLIAENERQREEWVRLFAIDEYKGDLVNPAYTVPLSVEFLKAYPTLVVDTSLFPQDVAELLIDGLFNLDHLINGTLVNGENSQSMTLGLRKWQGQCRFIYIDPPYNTGSDEFVYRDSYRHSSWMTMMHDRLVLARTLLAEDGSIAVSIDQHEVAGLRQVLDDVFGYENLLSLITVRRASVSGHKVVNPGVVNVSEYVLLYAKDRSKWVGNPVYSARDRDDRYTKFILNRSESHQNWRFCTVMEAFASHVGVELVRIRQHFGDEFEAKLHDFVTTHATSVVRLAPVRPDSVSAEFRRALQASTEAVGEVIHFPRSGLSDVYLLNGEMLLFYSDKVKAIGGRLETVERASDIWLDVLPNDLHNEGGVTLKKGKKPETLISRLVALCSDEGDLVCDFFAGSGTTAAVCQKMNRLWLGIEINSNGEFIPHRRLANVLNGENRGVSRQFGWKGGGVVRTLGLECYEDALNNLALQRTPTQQSLLELDAAQGDGGLKEQYVLKYMLDVESRGSQSLLNVEAFQDPTAYKLKVKRPGSDESQEMNVDLLETFNWLIGLTVQHIAAPMTFSAGFERDTEERLRLNGALKPDPNGPWWFRTVTGTTPDGRRTLVIWRKLTGNAEEDNLVLNEWFTKQGYSTKDSEFDRIYVNGGNNLGNLQEEGENWKVRLLEEEFHRQMFDTEGR